MIRFSIVDLLASKVADSWGRRTQSDEFREHRRLVEQYGELENHHAVRIPGDALQVRDLTAGGDGGYLVGTAQGEYLPALVPFAAPLALGATVVQAGRENIAYPRSSAGVTGYWLGGENAIITESQPTIGQLAVTPKHVAALVEISHQALKQSNAETVIRLELARAIGGKVTEAVLAGTGISGEPLGLVSVPGIGAFTGTSLDLAALRNAQTDIAAAIIDRAAVGFISTPAVAALLAARQRFTGSDRALWEGASHDGTVEGVRAIATTACPLAAAFEGDWSQCWIIEWGGGAQLQVDPYTKFSSGIVAVRIILDVDVMFPRAGAFTAASGIT